MLLDLGGENMTGATGRIDWGDHAKPLATERRPSRSVQAQAQAQALDGRLGHSEDDRAAAQLLEVGQTLGCDPVGCRRDEDRLIAVVTDEHELAGRKPLSGCRDGAHETSAA